MSGTLAAIFSFEASKKWIIREGLTGISRGGSGAPIASGWKKSRGFRIVRNLQTTRFRADLACVSPFVRGLVGIPVYAFALIAAEAGRLFSYHTPVAVQIGVFAAINVGYGLALGSWWALLVPGLAGLLALSFLYEPSPLENTDGSTGLFWLAVFVLPAAVMIVAGVVVRKATARAGVGGRGPDDILRSETD
jgi:hypothetical protein